MYTKRNLEKSVTFHYDKYSMCDVLSIPRSTPSNKVCVMYNPFQGRHQVIEELRECFVFDANFLNIEHFIRLLVNNNNDSKMYKIVHVKSGDSLETPMGLLRFIWDKSVPCINV